MKCFVAATLILGMFPLCMSGCAKKTTTESETKITTPGGETTIKMEKDVKKNQ